MECHPDQQEILRHCPACARLTVLLATGHRPLWECARCGAWIPWPRQPAAPDLTGVTVLADRRAPAA
ncbi:MAG: hypothetical protein IRZ08_03420 [Frankia sp.]|nr:hypothetical protein [Frankia sp.]